MRLSRFIPRFSLRTLLLLTLLIASGAALWRVREPWVLETKLETGLPQCQHIFFSPDARRLVVLGHKNTVGRELIIQVWDCLSHKKLWEITEWPWGSVIFTSDSSRLIVTNTGPNGQSMAIRDAAGFSTSRERA